MKKFKRILELKLGIILSPLLFFIISIPVSYFYFSIRWIFNTLIILFFVYLIFLFALVQKYIFLKYVLRLAKKLGFYYYVRFRDQPRIKGQYKDHEFQIHYRYKIGGKYAGKERTYVKLKLKKRFHLDSSVFDKHKKLKRFNILSIRYILRSKKQYLLMKVAGYIVDKPSIVSLMDNLYEVYKEARVNKGEAKDSSG
ncbi:hypothetical protein GF327_05990 [Candidatus Woesearchaeota archaeon]|nr:hypothetical protein [Candidatus Woesearchaeota archaeon]